MRNRISTTFALSVFSLVLFAAVRAAAFAPDEDLTARAAVLMDADTGKILYQKDADLRLPPASTTKIATAVLALESGRSLKQKLKVSKEATRVPASKLYLRPGQTLSIEELLYGIMLASANDASIVLAEGIAGSVERFTDQMTKKAHQIGATNTHFTNPHGLTAPDHYSTARDLALIFRYAMKNPMFRDIVQTKFSSVNTTAVVRKKVVPRRISVRNHNRLLWGYEGALGGKTGYTLAAQKCFVGAVQRNGATLIIAILGARDQWGDTRRLLDYGFEHYDSLKAELVRSSALERQAASRKENPTGGVAESVAENRPTRAVNSYVLQLATFREFERAELVSRQLSAKGFDVFIEETSLPEGVAGYRVRVGPYTELATAQETAASILSKSGYRPLILPAVSALEYGSDGS